MPPTLPAISEATVKREGIGALAFIPLWRRQADRQVHDLLRGSARFGDAEIDLAVTIARQLGFSLERMRAEDARRKAEADLSDFFENASVGLHWVGPDGIILRANRPELEMLGYAR